MSDQPAAASVVGAFPVPPAKPDHPELERRILAAWELQGTFDQLRAQIKGRQPWSFIDGPITANNPMGVHHAWGRTLKDVFQRWHAMRGFDQRFQNGFDCQGLWVEVEVEKSLGLNSKHEIEDYGLDRFSAACRDRVAEYSEVQTEQSKRLGQWMDWDNDYYTLSDTNIEYIWKFLAEVKRRDWLYIGHRPMTWCPRCGTSLSQHELIDSYNDVTHPSLFVRFPLLDREDESVVVWTTTPWTLPANVAAAVKPDATYALVEYEDRGLWVVSDRVEAVFGEDANVMRTAPGSDLVGERYSGPFDELPAAEGAAYRVVGWDEVGTDEGTGIVHIAPGCGTEDFELGKREDLTPISPVDEAGIFYDGFGFLTGITTHDAAPVVTGELRERGLLVRAMQITHRFPHCWRCSTELIFRLVDEWFIRSDEIRQPMIEANRGVSWEPSFYGKRMEDWLTNMGDWCISRRRYWGLPLPFYPCEQCDDVIVLDSREQLAELAVSGLEGLKELHRPWIDDVVIACPKCGSHLHRLADVGDAWLDAGIVPFSTLGWKSPEYVEHGYATGASAGLSGADLLLQRRVGEVVSRGSRGRDARADPAVVLLDALHVRDAGRPRAVQAGARLREGAGRDRPRHAQELGQRDLVRRRRRGDGRRHHALDLCGPDAVAEREIRPGTGERGQASAAHALERPGLLHHLRQCGRLAAGPRRARRGALGCAVGRSRYRARGARRGDARAHRLDRWLAARTHLLVDETTRALDRWDTPAYTRAVERYVDELSNWYVRRSRRRFWKAEEGEADRDAAYGVLWSALVTLSRVLAPVMPFLAEELWGTLVDPFASDDADLPESVHLTWWPQADSGFAQSPLLDEVGAVQRVAALGRAARSAAKQKLRQPLRTLVVYRRSQRGLGTEATEQLLSDGVADLLAELSVKEVQWTDDPAGRWSESIMPLLPKLGPKYGKDIAKIRAAIAAGDVDILDDESARVGEFNLAPDEYEHRSQPVDGYAIAEDQEWVVAVSTELDEELILEGLAREIVRALQQARKDSGLEVADRIAVRWSAGGLLGRAFEAHSSMIADEVLASGFEQATETQATELSVDEYTGSFAIERV